MNYKKELLSKLNTINEACVKLKVTIEIVIVGGSAFLLHDMIDRVTEDIDVINDISDDILIPLSEELTRQNIDLNKKVRIFKHNFRGWENEIVVFQKLSNISINSLSKEMLIASKFFTRPNDRDITEAAYKGLDVSQEKIEIIVANIWKNSSQITKRYLWNREMEIVEFYRAMRWDYENSIIKNFCKQEV